MDGLEEYYQKRMRLCGLMSAALNYSIVDLLHSMPTEITPAQTKLNSEPGCENVTSQNASDELSSDCSNAELEAIMDARKLGISALAFSRAEDCVTDLLDTPTGLVSRIEVLHRMEHYHGVVSDLMSNYFTSENDSCDELDWRTVVLQFMSLMKENERVKVRYEMYVLGGDLRGLIDIVPRGSMKGH